MGRFLTPDPYRATNESVNNPAVPQSWNRYTYVGNDPVNFNDPQGLFQCAVDGIPCDLYQQALDLVLGFRPQGTGPTPPRPIPVHNLQKSGENYLKVQDAFALMLASLDPDCESYLNSGGGNARSYVSDLFALDLVAVGSFQQGKAAFTGTQGTDVPEGYAAMVFNTVGAFFKSNLFVNNGRIEGGSKKAQTFIILHELAHGLGAKGFENDFNKPDAGKRNDDRIDANCKKTLASIN